MKKRLKLCYRTYNSFEATLLPPLHHFVCFLLLFFSHNKGRLFHVAALPHPHMLHQEDVHHAHSNVATILGTLIRRRLTVRRTHTSEWTDCKGRLAIVLLSHFCRYYHPKWLLLAKKVTPTKISIRWTALGSKSRTLDMHILLHPRTKLI